MDERQELKAGRAAMITLGVLTMGALGVLAWEYLTTKDVTNTAAVVVLLGGGGLFALLQRMTGAEAPRSLLGLELPTEDTPQARSRRTRAYLVDSVATGGAMTGLAVAGVALGDQSALPPVLTGVPGMVLGAALTFAVLGGLTFVLDKAMGESASRAVERRLAAQGD